MTKVPGRVYTRADVMIRRAVRARPDPRNHNNSKGGDMDFQKVISRLRNIALAPREEWPVIAAEAATPASIYTGYLLLLAAVPAVIGLLDAAVFGYSVPFLGTVRLGFGAALQNAAVSYVASLAGVYVFALIVNALAPTFGGQKDSLAALKVAAYSASIGMVAGVAQIVPWIGGLVALAGAAYGAYVLYLGLPPTMKCPQEKAAAYAAVSILVALVAGALFWGLLGRTLMQVPGLGGPTTSILGGARDAGDIKVDPDSPLGRLEEMGRNMEAAGKKMEEAQKSGDVKAQGEALGAIVGAAVGARPGVQTLEPATIGSFLPATLGALPRRSFETERNAALGLQVSRSEARYGRADGSGPEVKVEITDLGGTQGIMLMAAWAGIEMERETEDGYEKTYRDGDRVVHEEWRKSSGDGQYSLILGERFLVSAEGSGIDMAGLKAAVAGLDLRGLEALKGEGG